MEHGMEPNGGSKILLSPWVGIFNSRFNSMMRLGEFLIEDGHEVSILVPTFLVQHVKNKKIEVIEFKMDAAIDVPGDYKATEAYIFELGTQLGQFVCSYLFNTMELPQIEYLYKDTLALRKLKERGFDLLFADGLFTFTRAVIDFMDIPTVLYSADGTIPDNTMFYPVFPSFVCSHYKGFCGDGEELSFWRRLQNFVSEVGLNYYFWPSLTNPVDALKQKYNINASVSSRDSYGRHLVIANMDSVMEPPQPLMPHIIQISGLFVNDPKPLKDHDVAAFMDSATEHGAIIMSLGTLVNAWSNETDAAIADIFSKLPQKVIWKNQSEVAVDSSNVLLTKWMDQQNLLAHKNTKLFITHGGSHSMYETALRGVPVICIPFFLDQLAHCKSLASRLKMGVLLEPSKITRETFTAALSEVLSNPIYTNNAKRIQSISLDKPMNPKDLFLYWINYAIRHKGAHHLVSTVPFELNIFQYLSLDVVAFLSSIPVFTLVIIRIILKHLCKCTKTVPKDYIQKKEN